MDKFNKKQKKLVTENIGLLYSFHKKTMKENPAFEGFEDFVFERLAQAFCVAAQKFDKEKAKFSTFAYNGMRMQIKWIFLNIMESHNKNYYVDIDGISEIFLADKKKNEKIDIDEELLSLVIEETELSQQEKTILIDYYFENATLNTIANKIKKSKERVRQIRVKALDKIRMTSDKKRLDFYSFV